MLKPLAILFDLDGTLADTAPDLAAAVNLMRTKRGLAIASYLSLRPFASAGARGLLDAGLDVTPDHPDYEALRDEFLGNYASSLATHSKLFDGIPALLSALAKLGIAWGIVTNKAERYTTPIVPLLNLQTAQCVISGDTTAHAKPHPAPLLEAAKRLNVDPKGCWYIGDDLRDIQAGLSANMQTVAAAWGYCGALEPTQWKAHAIAATPSSLLEMINAAQNAKSHA